MDGIAFVARVRDHYVDQFRAFADKQKRSCEVGAAEVKLRLSDRSELFRRLYCVDFAGKTGGEHGVVELQPAFTLTFGPMSCAYGAAAISIEHLRWDDVDIHHDLAALPQEEIASWFERWFDPDDKRAGQTAEFSNVIHSLLIRPGCVTIDFGTAPPDAFWELLNVLEQAGATEMRISSSKAETGDQEAAS
jgi:hypothetical protein